ncbi:hypothetical protein D9756_008728 [Leucocoprinus leucothites]|uniref:Uncharacterized protein n=1 Tax=Leucocoprinus leucothites TaxID=201217 RepID=A0A8H5D0K4_9AGAR|nr:hypothetical protein D9756_008728 [Leucoagaricus leucothites]
MFPADFDLSPTYGVLLIGVLLATFFQGVLTIQAYQYYQDFPEDPRATKIFVAVLWILDFVQLIFISYTVYYYLVVNWGNVQALMRLILPFSLHLFPVSFIILFSQLFFLYRIWIFSQRNVWIVGPIFICCLGNFGLVFATGMFAVTNRPVFSQAMITMVTVGSGTDIMIAALLCYYVRKRSEGTREMKSLDPSIRSLNARRQFRETLESIEPSFANSRELGGISTAIRRIPRLGTSTRGFSPLFPTIASQSIAEGNDVKFEIESLVQVPLTTYPPRLRHSLP